MLRFMDYVLDAFGDASNWDRDNSYSSLTATSDGISCILFSPVLVFVDLTVQRSFPSLRRHPLASMCPPCPLLISQHPTPFPLSA